jgi:hypothetical protein
VRSVPRVIARQGPIGPRTAARWPRMPRHVGRGWHTLSGEVTWRPRHSDPASAAPSGAYPVTANHVAPRRPPSSCRTVWNRYSTTPSSQEPHHPPPTTTGRWTEGVTQEPEPLSPRNRNRVPNLSPTCRSHGVHHEPRPHSIRARNGFREWLPERGASRRAKSVNAG